MSKSLAFRSTLLSLVLLLVLLGIWEALNQAPASSEAVSEYELLMGGAEQEARVPPPSDVIKLAVEELGNPILSTSATDPEGEILESVVEIEERLGHALDLVIDGGPVSLRPSSVVSLIDDSPEIIREGQGDVSVFL